MTGRLLSRAGCFGLALALTARIGPLEPKRPGGTPGSR